MGNRLSPYTALCRALLHVIPESGEKRDVKNAEARTYTDARVRTVREFFGSRKVRMDDDRGMFQPRLFWWLVEGTHHAWLYALFQIILV